jgi:anaerobic magnesium-protoporphyrin IX monomethyl ester cyclase
MADILFTHSYFLSLDPKERKAMMPYAPLGTLYAASQARARGHRVALFDSMLARGPLDIEPLLVREQPGVVVIYDDDFNYLTKMCLSRMREAAFTICRLARQHGCTVIVHGSDPADHGEDYIRHGAHYVIVGEGETTLGELLDRLARSDDAATVTGLIYSGGRTLVHTGRREVLQDLDILHVPARDLLDTERYRALWKKRHGYFSMNIVTTRGCPFHCNWCAKPMYGQVYHSRSPENVCEEIEMLKKEYRPDHLWMCDDIFGLKPGWIPEFADGINRRNTRIPFKCLSRPDLLLKEETIRHLKRAGCQTVWIGAESGSQKILDAMEKGTRVEQIYASTRLLHESGIRVGFFLQYGYTGETRADIDLTLRMVRECKPDEIGISVSYPLPGTKFFENVRSDLGQKQNWTDSRDLDPMVQASYTPDFYRTLHRLTHKKFRLWQGIDLVRQSFIRPSFPTRQSIRRIASAAYHALTLPGVRAELEVRAKDIPAAR